MTILSSLFGKRAVSKIAMETRWVIGLYSPHDFTFDRVSHRADYSGVASSYLASYVVDHDTEKANSST
jgi:hypothetical protein